MTSLTRSKPLCTVCKENGFTLRDTTAYRCSACGHSYGRQRFKDQHVKDFKRGSVKKLKCEDCT